MSFIYSICMCNFNMEDTIERSLESIFNQVNDDFEVVLVDDGSSDNSVKIVKKLQLTYKNLNLIQLKRDSKRKLGFTRNIAIKEAKGKYVMLHLDCDDIFGPYLDDFAFLFHKIESAIGYNILLSGKHINMASREFLISYGPYKNIYRGEDRDLWSRLAKNNAYIPLQHIDFITRLPKTTLRRFTKSIYDTLDHMVNDFRFGTALIKYLELEVKKWHLFSFRLIVIRLLLIFPAWLFSLFLEPFDKSDQIGGFEKFAEYRSNTIGTFSEIMERNGKSGDLSFLKPDAQLIFK